MKIEVNCPQCGGKINFDEKSFVIKCDYCGSTLHLSGKDQVCAFRLKPKHSLREAALSLQIAISKDFGHETKVQKLKLVYAPYWRVTGMVFRWQCGKKDVSANELSLFGPIKGYTKELSSKLLDVTFPAYVGYSLGLENLGVRASVLPLLLFGKPILDDSTQIMGINKSFEEAQRYIKSVLAVGTEIDNFSADYDDIKLIGERYSIVYFPFWLAQIGKRGRKAVLAVDAITQSSVRHLKQQDILAIKQATDTESERPQPQTLRFIPFKCPVCGWELPYNPNNSLHVCDECKRGWVEYGGKFHRVRYKVARVTGTSSINKNLVFLPFWRLRGVIHTSDGLIESLSDLTGRGYQPYRLRSVSNGKIQPLQFMIPAFKIRSIPAFNKIASQLTTNYTPGDVSDQFPGRHFKIGGTILSFREAEEMANIVIFSLIPKFARKIVRRLKNSKMEFQTQELLYLPFAEEKFYLREINTGIAIQKASVYTIQNSG